MIKEKREARKREEVLEASREDGNEGGGGGDGEAKELQTPGGPNGNLSTEVAWVRAKAVKMREHVEGIEQEIAKIKRLGEEQRMSSLRAEMAMLGEGGGGGDEGAEGLPMEEEEAG